MNLQDRCEPVGWARQDTLFLAFAAVWTAVLLVIVPAGGYMYRGDMGYFHAVEFAVRDAIQSGQWPLWNIYFSEPLLANPQAMVFYPTHALLRFLPIQTVMTVDVGFHFWLMAAALYLLLRDWGLSRLASMGGSLTVGFSTLVVVRAVSGHLAQLPVFPWAILAVVLYRRLLNRRRLGDFLLTTLATVIIVLSGHTQQSLTALMIPGSYFVLYALSGKGWRDILRGAALSALVGAVSLGLLAVQLLPTLEYFPLTSRIDGFTLERASVYPVDPVRLLNLLTPFMPLEFEGAPIGFQESTMYTGLMTIGLVIIAWRWGPDRYRGLVRYLVIVGLLTILLAMGTYGPLFGLFFRLLPFLRAPGRFLQIWTFCAALLSGIGIEALLTRWGELAKPMRSALWFTLLLITEIVIILYVVDVYIFTAEPVETDMLPLFLISLGLIAIWLAVLLIQRTRLSHEAWMRIFVGGLLLDATVSAVFLMLWPTYRTIYPTFRASFQPDGPYACIAERIDPREIRVQQGGDHSESTIRIAAGMGIPVIHFYSANLFYVYDLYGRIPNRLDLIAASYRLDNKPTYVAGWPEVIYACGLTIWRGPDVMPRVYAVSDVRVVPDTREASLAAVQAGDFDPARTAILSRSPDMPGLPPFPATPLRYQAEITAYSANTLTVVVETSQPALVVVAEPYYPGWQATVDGAPAPILRANHALRGIVVEGGEHEIVLEYHPESFFTGLKISLITLAVLGIGCAATVIRQRSARLPHKPPG